MEELFGGCLLRLLIWLILLPVSLVVATPFILVWAFWGEENYVTNVKNAYAKVCAFWFENGWFFWW